MRLPAVHRGGGVMGLVDPEVEPTWKSCAGFVCIMAFSLSLCFIFMSFVKWLAMLIFGN